MARLRFKNFTLAITVVFVSAAFFWMQGFFLHQFFAPASAQTPPSSCDASPHNTCLWAWNDHIGWISHNSVDNPSVPKYGMHIDETAGAVSGYIWNDAAGWINLAPAAGFPSAPFNGVKYDSATRQLSGWALIEGYGVNGWVKLRDTAPFAYGVSIAANGDFSGYAWNDTIGWIEFAPAGYAPAKYDKKLNPSVSGWAWNDTLGWISLNFIGYDVEYGVDVIQDGKVTGWAWSEIGWIQYNPSGPYPSSPNYSTRWDPVTGQVSGWAKAVGMTGAYSGTAWIKMRSVAGDSVNYGVTISRTTGNWGGYAWNDTFGWIQYAHSFGAVNTKFTFTAPSKPVLQTILNCTDTYTSNPAAPLSPTLTWSNYVALDGGTQQAYRIMLDNDPLFGSPLIDETVASAGSSYSIGLNKLSYGRLTYYWRVQVQSTKGDWSEWGTTGTLGTESNCFQTPLHPAPVCNFTMMPPAPVLSNPVQFKDTSTTSGGANINQWRWNFGDGETFSGSNPLVHKNPKHTYAALGNITPSLSATDSDGYSCYKSLEAKVSQVLPDFKRVIPR
ncbi:MAG: PKD domain-containing protein [Parcubacteria group bacterium]|nr:PKD domain-containing protein [Parcubacteria group bacterium]